jgi:predicted RNA-binding protein
LERQFISPTAGTQLLAEGKTHVESAKKLKDLHHEQTIAVHAEIEAVARMLRDGTFYEPVTNVEMRAVIAAMATEFSGTGHWVSTSIYGDFQRQWKSICIEGGGVVLAMASYFIFAAF